MHQLTLPDDEKLQRSRRSRALRHAMRSFLHEHDANGRVSGCGVAPLNGKFVRVNVGTGVDGRRKAGASNLATCGSVWSCPVCSHKISSQRGLELGRAAEAWTKQNGAKVFVTFTLRHDAFQELEQIWDALNGAWKYLLGGKGWQTMKSEHDLAGWVRAVEVTHGSNGWHVHAHTVFFVNPDVVATDQYVQRLSDALWNRWNMGVNKQGFTAERTGFDIRRSYSDSPLARYMSKNANAGLGKELTMSSGKHSRTPFRILADLVARDAGLDCTCTDVAVPGNRCDACLWRNWSRGSTGRRMLTWSGGIRDLIRWDLVPEDTDETLIDSRPVMGIHRHSWWYLYERNLVTTLYERIEEDGEHIAIAWLRSISPAIECWLIDSA